MQHSKTIFLWPLIVAMSAACSGCGTANDDAVIDGQNVDVASTDQDQGEQLSASERAAIERKAHDPWVLKGIADGLPVIPENEKSHPHYNGFEGPRNIYGIKDADLGELDTEKAQSRIIGMGWAIKPSTNTPDATAARSNYLNYAQFDSNIVGRCGVQASFGTATAYLPCAAWDTSSRAGIKFRIDDTSCCVGTPDCGLITNGLRKGFSRWNEESDFAGSNIHFKEVTSGENVTVYCTNGNNVEGSGSFNNGTATLAAAYPYGQGVVTNWGPTSGGSPCVNSQNVGPSNPFWNNDTGRRYRYPLYAMPIQKNNLLTFLGQTCSAAFGGRTGTPLNAAQSDLVTQGATTLAEHEIGHMLGLNHLELDTNGTNPMLNGLDCDHYADWVNSIDSRIMKAVKDFNTADSGSTLLTFDDSLECLTPSGFQDTQN